MKIGNSEVYQHQVHLQFQTKGESETFKYILRMAMMNCLEGSSYKNMATEILEKISKM